MAACLEVPLEDSNMLNAEERGHMDILIEICPQVKGFLLLACVSPTCALCHEMYKMLHADVGLEHLFDG